MVKYFRLIEAECNEMDALDFDPENLGVNSRTRCIGHLIRFSFPGVQTEMVQDLSLTNPEKPAMKDPAVGVFNFIGWEGEPGDPINFDLKISPRNKAILQEAFCSSTNEIPVMEVEFVIYDYDYHNKTYFKKFYTIDNPVKFVPSEDYRFNIYGDIDYSKKPIMASINGSLMPMNGIENQKVGFAYSATGPKFTREIGESAELTYGG